MKRQVSILFTYYEYDSIEDLEKDDRFLTEGAIEAARNAYAPYSHYYVGAAVRLESGMMLSGTNVENAAFPSGICAERNVVANAVSNHRNDRIEAIAIAALTSAGLIEDPVTPCGNCRQVLTEEEVRNGNKIKIILTGVRKIIVIEGVENILPLRFNSGNLKATLPLQ